MERSREIIFIKKINSYYHIFRFASKQKRTRAMLTIHVSVASTERSFSKLKLIKSYLRSSMCQERLSELPILSVEKELLDKLEYTNFMGK